MKRLVFPLLMLLTLGACGKKGTLVHPDAMRSVPPAGLLATVRPEGVELSWEKAEPPAGRYVVLRRERTEGDCETCSNAYGEIGKVDTAIRRPSAEGRFSLLDERISPATIYRYRVISVASDGTKSAPSQFVEIAVPMKRQ